MVTRFQRYRSQSIDQMIKSERMAAAARAAGTRRAFEFEARLTKWRGDEFQQKLKGKIGAQLTLVGQLLRDKVVINISRPVMKISGGRGAGGRFLRKWVDPQSRSRPGEFPKADTTDLKESIFYKRTGDKSNPAVRVGTTLGYGAALELSPRLRRSFLRRTLIESGSQIATILKKPYRTILGSETT